MKIIIDGIAFSGSPTDIVDTLRELLFKKTELLDIEEYITHIQTAFRQVFNKDMILPQTALDNRIRAMFSILEENGLAEVIEYV